MTRLLKERSLRQIPATRLTTTHIYTTILSDIRVRFLNFVGCEKPIRPNEESKDGNKNASRVERAKRVLLRTFGRFETKKLIEGVCVKMGGNGIRMNLCIKNMGTPILDIAGKRGSSGKSIRKELVHD